jgi:hypothetical protein
VRREIFFGWMNGVALVILAVSVLGIVTNIGGENMHKACILLASASSLSLIPFAVNMMKARKPPSNDKMPLDFKHL